MSYRLLINKSKEVIIPQAVFEKLPKDSMLYNLLNEEQGLRTKNENGQYELTLDYPNMFEIAVNSAIGVDIATLKI